MAGSVNKVILVGNLGKARRSGKPRTGGRSPIWASRRRRAGATRRPARGRPFLGET